MKTWFTAVAALVIGFVGGILITASGLVDQWSPGDDSGEFGHFPATAKLESLGDGRSMKLLEDFVYIDPDQISWKAGMGEVVNGASIPPVFWSIVGSPFAGKYRDASIVHDIACKYKMESSDDVHLMFYNACRCQGVPEKRASMLYAAVYLFGDNWERRPVMETRTMEMPDGTTQMYVVNRFVVEPIRTPEATEENVARLARYIEENNPSLDKIRSLETSDFGTPASPEVD